MLDLDRGADKVGHADKLKLNIYNFSAWAHYFRFLSKI